MATDQLLHYSDPTGNTAAAHVDRERRARLGLNPDATLHAADKHLIPTEYLNAEEERTSYMRDEHGHRVSISPWYDPAWTRRRRERPLTNDEVVDLLITLAPALTA